MTEEVYVGYLKKTGFGEDSQGVGDHSEVDRQEVGAVAGQVQQEGEACPTWRRKEYGWPGFLKEKYYAL